ncbi:MAG TPA: calcium/sodium antiporter, partial [Draconibacterium sp.]|nr:calcium/sodium antiporter [Draconibacterium sp.]
MIVIYILALLACFVLLARVVDLFFISSLDKISKDLRLSNDAAGATLMAVGSSAPELFVALFAVIKPGEHQVIGIGSIVGSAIFNLLVIVGASALVRKATLTKIPVIRDLIFYSLSVALLVIFIWDGKLDMAETAILLCVYLFYVVAVVYWRKWFNYEDIKGDEVAETECDPKGFFAFFDHILCFVFPKPKRYYLIFFISIVIIAALSWGLVELAVVISHALNISEAIIALTVLAIGTSVPDLFSSLIVAKQGRGDMAVSNAIGSNIFDILVGLGLPFILVMLFKGGTIEAGGDLLSSTLILSGSVV